MALEKDQVSNFSQTDIDQFLEQTIKRLNSESQAQYRKNILAALNTFDPNTIPMNERRQAFLSFSEPLRLALSAKKTVIRLFALSSFEMTNNTAELLPILDEMEEIIRKLTNLLCKLANVSELHVPISQNTQADHFVTLKSTESNGSCEPNSFTRVYPGI